MLRACQALAYGILFAPFLNAAGVQNAVFSLAEPSAEGGCASPLPTDYFLSSDQQMVLWAELNSLNAGDKISLSWASPSGKLDGSYNFSPVQSAGGFCFTQTQPLSSNPASYVSGNWKFQVTVNGKNLLQASTYVVAPNQPTINRGGVMNSASGSSGVTTISGGSLVSIFGSNLAPSTMMAPGEPLPLSLNGVSVTFNGTPVGIYQVAPNEVDVMAPWSIPNDTVMVQVNNNGSFSNSERTRVSTASPGIFYDATTAAKSAAVYRFASDGSDGGWVSASNPLLRGDTAVLLATGMGPVMDPSTDFAPGNSDSVAVLPIGITLSGVTAGVQGAALSAGTTASDPGLSFVYFAVPNEAPNGSAVTINMNVAGISANAVTTFIGGTAPAAHVPTVTALSQFPTPGNGPFRPGSTLSVSANGLYTDVPTFVRFSDGQGYQVDSPAIDIYPGQVVALVPPYVNQKTHSTNGGTVSCALVQVVAGTALISNSTSVQLDTLYAAPGSQGQVTSMYLASLAEGARNAAGYYIYKQQALGSNTFTASSAEMVMQQVTGGVRPLVGGALEISAGNATSETMGNIGNQPVNIDNNMLAVTDAMLAAVMRESRAAVASLPPSAALLRARKASPQGILGSIGTIIGHSVECNMPWNAAADFVTGQQSNCPTVGQAFDSILVAGAQSLVEAVDGTAQDVKRFASGLGMVAGVLAPEAEIPVLLAKFGGAASAAQAIGNIAAYVVASGTASDTEGRQEVMTEALNTLKDMAKDSANDYFDKMDIGLGTALGGNSEELEKDSKAILEAINNNGDVSIQTLAQTMGLNSDSLTALALNLAGPYITQQNGVLTLVSNVWNSPALEFTGSVTDSNGDSLNNVGADLNSGTDLGAPFALGGTNGSGKFDLLVPAAAVGSSIPSSATFEISTLDEDGDMVTFTGNSVSMNSSRSIGAYSIKYDSDDDDDDDSDGSDAIPVHRPAKLVSMGDGRSDHRRPAGQARMHLVPSRHELPKPSRRPNAKAGVE